MKSIQPSYVGKKIVLYQTKKEIISIEEPKKKTIKNQIRIINPTIGFQLINQLFIYLFIVITFNLFKSSSNKIF